MQIIASKSVAAIGEAMVEVAPCGDDFYRLGFAGDTYNTLWHMAHLLGPDVPCKFVTKIGTDQLSDRFLSEMKNDGLLLSGITRDPTRSMGLYLIELEHGERNFQYWRSNSAARSLAESESVLKDSVDEVGLIHVSGITLAILPQESRRHLFGALARARRRGSVISFDPNVRLRLWKSADDARETIDQMLALVDIALPSFDDEKLLWGDTSAEETIRRLRSKGVGEIIVKNGSQPIAYQSDSTIGLLDTPPVARVFDTTGAGDGFNAGFLSARLVGAPIAASIIFGQKLSAHVIGHAGARGPRRKIREIGLMLQTGLPEL